MIPAWRLLVAAGALLTVALAAAFDSSLAPAWRVAAMLVLLAALGDAAVLWARAMPAATRTAPGSLPLGIWHRISLRLANPSARARKLEVFDQFWIQVKKLRVKLRAMNFIQEICWIMTPFITLESRLMY